MKKRLWGGLLALIFPMLCTAQLSVGATSGFSLSSFRWPSSLRNNPQSETLIRGGLSGGILLEYELSSRLALHSELLFHQKGGKLRSRLSNSEGFEEVYETVIGLNYAEMPLLLRWYSNPSSFRILGGLGMAASRGLYGRDELTITTYKPGLGPVTNTAFRDIDFKSSYKGWDFSLIFEAGVSRSLGRGELTAALRYTHGLTNIIQETASSLSDLNNLRNRDLGIMLSYRIYLY